MTAIERSAQLLYSHHGCQRSQDHRVARYLPWCFCWTLSVPSSLLRLCLPSPQPISPVNSKSRKGGPLCWAAHRAPSSSHKATLMQTSAAFKLRSRLCAYFRVFLLRSVIPTEAVPRPENGTATILVEAGEYHETVNITRRGPLTLLVCAFVCRENASWLTGGM